MDQARGQAENLADLQLRGENNHVGVGKFLSSTWVTVWREEQWWVSWAIGKEADGRPASWGRSKWTKLEQFVNWARRMGLAEAEEQQMVPVEGLMPRPICEMHRIAMSGPLKTTEKHGLPQNVGKLFYSCSLKCPACKPPYTGQCVGGDVCCGLQGWLWADGSLPCSQVSSERRQKYEAEHAQASTPPAAPQPNSNASVTPQKSSGSAEDQEEAPTSPAPAAAKPKTDADGEPMPKRVKRELNLDTDEPVPMTSRHPTWVCGKHGLKLLGPYKSADARKMGIVMFPAQDFYRCPQQGKDGCTNQGGLRGANGLP